MANDKAEGDENEGHFKSMIFMAFQFQDCPALAALFSMDRFIQHKEMPMKEAMLASMENTGVDIMPAAVIPGDIPFSWK